MGFAISTEIAWDDRNDGDQKERVFCLKAAFRTSQKAITIATESGTATSKGVLSNWQLLTMVVTISCKNRFSILASSENVSDIQSLES